MILGVAISLKIGTETYSEKPLFFPSPSAINIVIFAFYCWLSSGLDSYMIQIGGLISPMQFLLISVCHGFALVTVGYAWSFIFREALSAVKYFPLIYFFILFLFGLFLADQPLRQYGYRENKDDPTPGYIIGFLCTISLLSVGITYYPSVVQNSLTILGSFCILGFITCICSFFVTCLVGFSFIVFLDQGDNDPPRETTARRSGFYFIRVPGGPVVMEVNGRRIIELPRPLRFLFN